LQSYRSEGLDSRSTLGAHAMSNPDPPPRAAPPSGDTTRWYIQRQRSRQLGPFTTEEIREGIRTGEIPVDSVVNEVGGKQWLPLSAVKDFVDLTQTARAAVDEPNRALRELRTTPTSVRAAPRVQKPMAVKLPRGPSAHTTTLGLVLAIATMAHAVLQIVVLGRAGRAFDSLRALQTMSLTREAFALVAGSVLLLGLLRRRTHPSSGTPLTAASALALAIGSAILVPASLLAAVRAPVFALLPASVRRAVLTQQLVLPCIVGIGSLVLLFLLGDLPKKRSIAATGALVVSLGLCVAFAVRSITGDREIVVLDPSLATFADREALRAYLEASREGTAGIDRVIVALSRATVIPKETRARWVDDLVLASSHGTVLGREVEIVEGDLRGRRVFVPLSMEKP